ncbi:BnaA09g54210D [Brassica napus]|uniref:BnaA09g54210D protein n=1 Tax=Brassica napus TaxID=3708 RepID=A0A078JD59_BRANA|nr:BnaA09g54210D [Brassica napus]
MIIWRVEYQNGCSPYLLLVPTRNKSREERERAHQPARCHRRTKHEQSNLLWSNLLQRVEEDAVSHNDLLERGTTPARDSRPINQAAEATPHTQIANPFCVFTCSSFHVLLGFLRVVDWTH